MMLRMTVLSTAVVILLGIASPAQAQLNIRGSSDNPVGPTVSPYLNLLQTNQFGATNYQSLVKPLIEQGNAINRQGAGLNRLQQQVYSQQSQGAGGSQSTGHATFFMNYLHYYPQQSR